MDVVDVSGAVKEMARVLRPEGRLVISLVHPFADRGRFVGADADAQFVLQDSYFGRRRFEERAGARRLTDGIRGLVPTFGILCARPGARGLGDHVSARTSSRSRRGMAPFRGMDARSAVSLAGEPVFWGVTANRRIRSPSSLRAHSEAIQTKPQLEALRLDCFALLAMTDRIGPFFPDRDPVPLNSPSAPAPPSTASATPAAGFCR